MLSLYYKTIMEAFKEQLLEYIRQERAISHAEIEEHRHMPDEEKEAAGLMIRHAQIDIDDNEVFTDEYRFRFDVNDTKIRIGDYVQLICERTNKAVTQKAVVHEIDRDYIILAIPNFAIDEDSLWSIQVFEVALYDAYIKVLEEITVGMPGSSFLEQLAGHEQPTEESMFGANPQATQMVDNLGFELNESQN